ncbi:MAG: preprotein translocase subunit YajC [Syntrophomonadaceae bacterium]|nr:preprotein translocase subunit YajC [Syntrophomonadaceae bacterium]
MEALASFLPIILLFVIFYFLLIRPQQAQQKKRKEMLASLQKGDRVVSIGGIFGMIKEIRDDFVVLRIADNVNIKMARAGIDRIIKDEE